MAKIILFGGHGRVALLLAPLLVKRGDEVTAVIRNSDHVTDVESTGASARVADVEILGVLDLAQLIDGHDAVVWSAGAGGGNPARTRAVDQDAAIRTIQAAEQVGVKRYVMVSYFNSSPAHDVPPEEPFFHYAEAKAAADGFLRSSNVDWTILGPSGLTLEPASGMIDTQASTSGLVSRGNVALTVAAVLNDNTTVHRTINFNDGTVPIIEAIGA